VQVASGSQLTPVMWMPTSAARSIWQYLSVLDADWGKTLHTGDEQFQGSADLSWSELDSQGTSSTWENDSFKDQNAIEADTNYVGSLEALGTSGVTGSNGNQDGSNSLDGEFFQNDAEM